MTTASSPSVQAPPAGIYRIDPQLSTVSYSGRHMSGLGTVHATFAVTSGEVQVRDPLAESTVVVSIDPASFSSGNARRDRDVVAASLLDCATHPQISFASRGLQEEAGHWVLSGTVTAHGEAVPVDVVIDRMTPQGNGMRVHARAGHLDRRAFGITGSRGMVGRYLDLDFDVLAERTWRRRQQQPHGRRPSRRRSTTCGVGAQAAAAEQRVRTVHDVHAHDLAVIPVQAGG